MKNWKNPSEFQDCLCTASSKPICLWFLSPLLYTNCTQVTWLDSKKKKVSSVYDLKKPAYYDCLDSGLILKNFLLDCQKIIIMLPKPMVAKENKFTSPNSIMELEACT